MVDFAELVLLADTRGLKRGEDGLDSLVRKGSDAERAVVRQQKSMAGAVADFGTKAAAALGAAAAAFVSFQGAAAAVAMARDFNAALVETSTLIEGTPQQLAQLEDAARSMGRAFGTDAKVQLEGLQLALSSGAASIADAATIMDSANRLAIGGAADATAAVGLLSGVLNAYGKESITAAQASDALFIGAAAGVTTISELSANLGSILPTAKAVGLSFDEVVGGVAALTLNSMNTSAAVTSLNAALNAAAAPSQQAKQLAAELGLEFSAAALEAKGLGGFLESVSAATNGNVEQMSILFGSVEALKTALLFAGEAGGQFADIMEQMGLKVGATEAAFAKVWAALDQRWNRAVAAAADVSLGLGQALLSVAVPALEAAAGAVIFVSDNADLLAISLGFLAASQIPAMVSGLVSLSAWLVTSEGLFIAGAVAAKGMAVAMNLIPWVAAIGLATALYRGLSDNASKAAEVAAAITGMTGAQDGLNAATERYYTNVSRANLEAMQTAANAARDSVRAALDVAQAELQAAEFTTNLFGVSLWETDRMAAAKAQIEQLSAALMETEARLSAADHAAANFTSRFGETGDVTAPLGDMSDLLDKIRDQLDDIETGEGMLAQLEAENELRRIGLQFGEQSREYALARADAEYAAFDATLLASNEASGLNDQLRNAYLTAQGLAGLDMASNIGAAAARAAELANQFGIALSRAAMIAAYENTAALTGLSGPDGVRAAQFGGGKFTPPVIGAGLRTPRVGRGGEGGGGGGGGGGGKSEADKAHEDHLRQAERLFESTRTEAEKYAAELEDLNELQKLGYLDADTYARAIKKVGEEFGNTGDAAKEWERFNGDLKDSMIDAAMGISGSFDDIGDAIKRALVQLILFNEGMFASGTGKGLLGGLFGGGAPAVSATPAAPAAGGGWLKKIFGSIFSFDGGGYTGDGPRSGGMDGKGGVMAMVHPQETIIDHSKGQTAAGGMTARVEVVVTGGNLELTDDGKLMTRIDVRAEQAARQGSQMAYGAVKKRMLDTKRGL